MYWKNYNILAFKIIMNLIHTWGAMTEKMLRTFETPLEHPMWKWNLSAVNLFKIHSLDNTLLSRVKWLIITNSQWENNVDKTLKIRWFVVVENVDETSKFSTLKCEHQINLFQRHIKCKIMLISTGWVRNKYGFFQVLLLQFTSHFRFF